MNYSEYLESVKNVEIPETLEYKPAFMWFHPDRLPLGLVSIGNVSSSVVKIPPKAVNQFGNTVPVTKLAKEAFVGRNEITDIILPSGITDIPAGAFAGCTGLRNITILKRITVIREKTFENCFSLENIFYEGSPEEWNRINIVHDRHEIEFGSLIPGSPVEQIISERKMNVPGNEALLSANIHFGCDLRAMAEL